MPTSGDVVNWTSLSNPTAYTVNFNATFSCLDFNMSAPASGNITFTGNQILNIYGSISIASSGITRTYTGAMNFLSTSVGKTVDINKTMANNMVFSGAGGGWTLSNNLNNGAANNFTFSASGGNLNLNGKTLTTNQFDAGSNTKTLNITDSTINSTNFSVNITDTLLSTGSIINANVGGISAPTFAGGSKTYNVVSFGRTGTTTLTITGTNTFSTLSITGGTSTSNLVLSGNQTVSGTLTINGNNSTTARIFVQSNTKGTQRTLTAATVVVTNADFQDIVGAGAGNWDLSAITGNSGDCGNCSGIIFTSPATHYWEHGASASYNYSTAANWFSATNGGGSNTYVPLPQDIAIFDNNSFSAGGRTVVQDMPRIGAIDFTGATNTPTFTPSTACSLFGSLTLISAMTLTSSAQTYTTENRDGSTITITSAGNKWAKNWIVNSPNGTTQLGDDFLNLNNLTFTVTAGNFNDNNHELNAGFFAGSNSNTRTITQNANWYLTGNNATIFTLQTIIGLTYNRGNNPINLTYSGSTGTRTVNINSAMSESTVPSISITAGSDATSMISAFYNLDFTGYTGTLANGTRTVYGNLVLDAGMSTSDGSSSTSLLATSGTQIITSNGATYNSPIIQSTPNSTVKLNDDFKSNPSRNWLLTSGVVDINSKNMEIGSFSSSNSNPRSIVSTNGGGTIKLTSTATITVWDVGTNGNLNISLSGTTIIIDSTTINTKTFSGGGKTYGNLWYTNTAPSGTLTINGNNTFSDFKCIDTNFQTIRFTAGTSGTVQTFTCAGSAANPLKIDSTSTARFYLINSPTGIISCDYLNIQHCIASPANIWYAGANSINNQSVATSGSGWIFTTPPSLTFQKTLMALARVSTKTVLGLTLASMKTWQGLT